MDGKQRWFLAGLFFATLATLSLEILNTRLLSVMTWYHISFFAVSIAMFGMAAGAVRVYLWGASFHADDAPRALARWGTWFAASIPVSHVFILCLPLTVDASLTAVAAVVIASVVLAAPFFLAGIVVAIALTRVPGRIGLIYAVDLVGAALGCLLVIPLLEYSNISSAALFTAAVAAIGAACFHRFAGSTGTSKAVAMALGLVVLAGLNTVSRHGLRVLYSKGNTEYVEKIQYEAWNTHSQVIARLPAPSGPSYWGVGPKGKGLKAVTVTMVIDGSAGTNATKWDGDLGALDWVRYDVTSLPYHLRKGGDVAIIGVGGGRDILTALWARSRSVTGIELNDTFITLLNGKLRDFTRIAERPDVHLVHDEARSYLTRADAKFDVLQMSLIDTWAATGAGAFTLSENGLYTREAWRVFVGAVKPHGILSVSRWFAPGRESETSRLLALGAAALHDRGVTDPSRNIALVACGEVATLLLSPDPYSDEDIATLQAAALEYDFTILAAPGATPAEPLFMEILRSRDADELARATADPVYDYSPPSDQQPYFFNMLKPGGLTRMTSTPGLIVRGNLMATMSLMLLGLVATGLVSTVILGPLWRAGLPNMSRRVFANAVAYFALIGMGFMMVEIPFIQRFSVYLGHPTYSIAVILFSMVLFTGFGSFLSDRLPVERNRAWLIVVPATICLMLIGIVFSIQPVIDHTISMGLFARGAITVGLAAPLGVALGFCFPIGLRLVARISNDGAPWMWGVNGACGVLASVLAVATSMWAGIHASLYVAVALYALLAIPALALHKAGRD